MDCYILQSRFFFALIFASLAFADESLVGTWEHESGQGTLTIRDDGTIALVTSIDVSDILAPTDLGFNDSPDIEEILAALLQDRSIQVSLAGTWRARGSRLLTTYQTAEVSGWKELVDDVMEVAAPAMEERLEDKDEKTRAALIAAYRGLLSSTFSAAETFQIGEETSAYWSIEGDRLTLRGDVYTRTVPTAIRSVSWGELKNRILE